METDADEPSHSAGGNPTGVHTDLPSPHFKHSTDITVTKTTQVTLTWTDDTGFFFPTCVYDWWLTEPWPERDKQNINYQYIPAYEKLLFYQNATAYDARTDFFHFVEPLHGRVVCRDLIFFTDEVANGDPKTVETKAMPSAYILFAEQYLPGVTALRLKPSPSRHLKADFLGKTTLPQCEVNPQTAIDLQNVQAIHAGGGLSFDVNFNKPCGPHSMFVKPCRQLRNATNVGIPNLNFTWMPMRQKIFGTSGNKAYLVSGNNNRDSVYFCNFDAYSIHGFGGPSVTATLGNKGYMLWFPEIPRGDDTHWKLRCQFFMTTTASYRLYSQWPNQHIDYTLHESHLGMLAKLGEEFAMTKYPLATYI